MTGSRDARRARSDDGVVLILMGVMMVAILIMVAIVIDLGQLRADRRDDQKSADLAALAAGFYMSGKASGPGDAVSNPRGGCEAALQSAKTNIAGFPSSASMNCAAFPEDALVCENWPSSHGGAVMPTTTVTTTNTASPFVLTVKYPVYAVPGGDLEDSRFAGGAGSQDGVNACARLLVNVQSTRDTFFASLVGVSEQTIDATSIVKGNINSNEKNVAALLLLERENCEVLSVGGQGTIRIESPTNNNPGRIQADSEGKGSCSLVENQTGYVIWASDNGNGRIEVAPTSSGKPGIIGIFSLTPGVDGRGGKVYTGPAAMNGLSADPIASGITSRTPADEKYNTAPNDFITQLHARAYTAVTSAAPSGATVVSGGACNAPPASIPGTIVYVDCASFDVSGTTVFPDAATVYFTGRVTVPGSLNLPVAQQVYVRGCRTTGSPPSGSTNCGNNPANAAAVDVSGTFIVNATTHGACPTPAPPIPGTTLTHRITEIATVGGKVQLSKGSSVTMCQTFLYAGRSASTYAIQTRANGAPNCDPTSPCPQDSQTWRDEGYIDVPASGGAPSDIYWSAPNRSVEGPTAINPFEDLAFWGESSRTSTLKGTGNSQTSGVFFMPNGPVIILGQGVQAVPQNAQFISRTLSLSGQGLLRLKPNPADAITTYSPGSYSLIR